MAELVHSTGGGEHRLHLSGAVTVGRAPDNDLVLSDHSVSRHHARIVPEGDAWRLIDVGSRNGTSVRGRAGADVLKDGDVVLFGACPVGFRDASQRSVDLSAPLQVEPAVEVLSRPPLDFLEMPAFTPRASEQDLRAELVRMHLLLSLMGQASASLLQARSLDEVLQGLLDVLFSHLPAERALVLLWDEKNERLVERAIKLRQGPGGGSGDARISRTIAMKVLRERKAVMTADAQQDPRFAGGASIMALGIRSAMAAPLSHGSRVIGLLWVDTTFEARAFDEFDLDVVSALANHAAIAVEQFALQENMLGERMQRQRLERYHSPAVCERIARDGGGETLVADERDVTVFFADVVGFTSRCESMNPRGVADFLNRCFSRMADSIFKHEGTLDKFIGDCVMAVFGAPLAMSDHAARAVQAALDMREAIEELNEELDEADRVSFRIGMNSGRVVAGDIGSVRRRDYTVLGATVNLASRLESSVARPGQIVVSDATAAALGDAFDLRWVADAQPKGISRIVKCYEVLGRRG